VSNAVPLLFAIEDPSVAATKDIASLVARLNGARSWTGGVVEFVDEVDDEGIRTLGGLLFLGEPTNNPDSERKLLEDVEFLIGQPCEFSRDGPALVVEYAGEEVGSIVCGAPDTSLREGLLVEWRKRLEAE
jgi:hypothetical protein